MSLNDPELVRAEYANEAGLATRRAVYANAGPGEVDVHDVVLEAVAAVAPSRVLEVGCGWGALAARIERETDASVVAVDLSPRMVELARERGVDARVGDVQALPFDDGEFDVAVAAWMLYHVPEVDRGLSELARVLRPGGRLVATTNGSTHLQELWRLVGRDRAGEPAVFRGASGEAALRRHFRRVDRRDIRGTVVFPDRDAVQAYVAASVQHKHLAERVPPLDAPLRARKAVVLFVAETAVAREPAREGVRPK